MKIAKKYKKTRSLLVLALGLLVTLILAASLYSLLFKRKVDDGSSSTSLDKTNLESPTTPQKEDGEKAKESVINRTDSPLTPPDPASEPNPLTIRSASYNSRENGVVITTRLENQASWSKCSLTMKKNETIIQEDSRVVYQDEASFCGGFFIPKEKLESGMWHIKLTASTIGGQVYETQASVAVP